MQTRTAAIKRVYWWDNAGGGGSNADCGQKSLDSCARGGGLEGIQSRQHDAVRSHGISKSICAMTR
jgi:hypothetical protein